MHLHQAPVDHLVERIMADPARGCLDGEARLPTLILKLRQAMEDGIHPTMPVCALCADPLFKVGSVTHVETFQKIPAIDVNSLLKPGEDVVLYRFLMHCLPWRGASQCPGSLQGVQIEVKVGGGVEADGVVLDEEMG